MERLSPKENPVYLFWKILWSFSATTGILALIISFFSLNTGLSGMTPPMAYAVVVFGAAIFLPLYMLPAYFAYRNRKKKAGILLLCNLLFGWTLVGYIICAVKSKT